MARKTFVIDTNVLFYDPEAILKFPGHDVVIPISVLDELDRKKKLRDELGRSARDSIQLMDSLRSQGRGDLNHGVEIDNGSTIRISTDVRAEKGGLSPIINENKVILSAHYLLTKGHDVTFISKDFAARVKAEALGLKAEDYRHLKASYTGIRRGVREVEIGKTEMDHFFKDGVIEAPVDGEKPYYANEYCQIHSNGGPPAIAHYNIRTRKLERLVTRPRDIWGMKPLNIEQECALDLLLREDINLVTLIGQAGTGKTLLAVACGLQKVFDEAAYTRMLVTRPIMPLGQDIGYLPGTKEEKLAHWMQPIHDNLEVLCGAKGKEPTDTLRWIVDSAKFEMEAVTYIRGRTLPNIYMIIDEAQNLTPHEVKTIISRAGKGTKVVLTGDPTQIDNPYLDQDSNGLTYTISRFCDQHIHGHIFLEKTERSELAASAIAIM